MLVNGIRMERVTLPLPRFGRQLRELVIVQVSDLHIRRYSSRERRLVDLVNGVRPDLIFITGDLVVNYTADFSAALQVAHALTAKFGKYAVLGNAEHTLRPRDRFEDFVSGLRNANVTVLQNSSLQISYAGQKIGLAGVDDPFFLFDDFDEAVRGLPEGIPLILLSHSPDIVLARADALAINLLDTGCRKEYFKTWGWATATYFGPETGELIFEGDGTHTMRVQSRQEGVSIDTLLLNPYPELDNQLAAKRVEDLERLLRSGSVAGRYPDLIAIQASLAGQDRCRGKWKASRDAGALSGRKLDDLPARRGWRYQPQVDPSDYFEIDVSAPKNVRYRLWMRMKALNGNPLTDSVYVQFSDALDTTGRRRYRIGVPAHAKPRLDEVDLILSGHTHGGQIRIPIYGAIETLTALGRRYAAGLHRFGKSLLYVSRGIGCSGMPFRFLCPPEITVFRFSA